MSTTGTTGTEPTSGASGSDPGTGSDQGTSSDPGTGSERGTGSDPGTGSDTTTGTGTGSRAATDGTPPVGRPRRLWPRVLAAVLALVLLAAAGLVVGVAWYFSGLALAVDRGGQPPVSVTAGVDASGRPDGTVVLPDTAGSAVEGLHGVRWQLGEESGWGVAGEVLSREDGRVVRGWDDRDGTLPDAGATGQVDQDVFLGSPGTVGLLYEDVLLDGELGDLPAHRVPAPASPTPEQAAAAGTWIVFAHGRGGQREEANRYLPLWHDLGYEVLVPSYRNDAGTAQDPSGRYGLGVTEWRDLDAAVAYALDNGAEQVVLAGWSMGGAVQVQLLAESEHAGSVVGLVLDAPVVDWRAVFEEQGDLAGLPRWLTSLAVRFVELRGGLDLDDVDWTTRADLEEVVDVPVYLVHSDDDAFVPNGPSRVVAERLGDLVTTRFDGPGDHTREWNVDPEDYDADMRAWFTETFPAR
ncbi:alpha/beta hydrolase family protein [Aquipuribacter hungaricus]|uniref:alpha/beta hydrolase family protein n=1 Tax=Aquipuribacter hungaricus TaxID=545624 RepID=UPI00360B0FEB